MKLTGHAAVFDAWTTIDNSREGRFLERVARGTFRKSILENRDRIRVLLSHGHDPQLGTKPLGPLEDLREDNRGLFYSARLLDGVPELLVSGLREGLYGASFRFQALREEFTQRPGRSSHNPEGLPERTLKEVRLVEIGPTPFGAYEAATAGVRSDDVIELRAAGGRAEILPAITSGDSPATLRRLRQTRTTHARTLLRELEGGATVAITWGGTGRGLGRVIERGRLKTDYLHTASSSRDRHLPPRRTRPSRPIWQLP